MFAKKSINLVVGSNVPAVSRIKCEALKPDAAENLIKLFCARQGYSLTGKFNNIHNSKIRKQYDYFIIMSGNIPDMH